MKMSSRFFQNRDCEFFPCHEGIPAEEFNCLFCYCPLYALGKNCGGNFRYNEKGHKVCTACSIPHARENYKRIIRQYPKVAEVIRREDER